jgi:4-hydroxybenzoate polyprenyltransferase
MVLAISLAQAAGWALGVALLGVVAFGLHMVRQMRRLDMDDAGSCLREFRSNRDAGLLAALFLAVAAAV